MAENLTIFQRLGKMFGPDGPRQEEPTYTQYKFSKKDLLKNNIKSTI